MKARAPYFLALVVLYDHPLRYHVPSRRKGVAPYLIELDAYAWNGTCQCEHFTCRLEPLLAQGLTPEIAFESGLAEIPEGGAVEDSLRCFHVMIARLKFADDHLVMYRNHEHTTQ